MITKPLLVFLVGCLFGALSFDLILTLPFLLDEAGQGSRNALFIQRVVITEQIFQSYQGQVFLKYLGGLAGVVLLMTGIRTMQNLSVLNSVIFSCACIIPFVFHEHRKISIQCTEPMEDSQVHQVLVDLGHIYVGLGLCILLIFCSLWQTSSTDSVTTKMLRNTFHKDTKKVA